jgi:hypothetical protein
MFGRLKLVQGDLNTDLAFLQTLLDWMTESQIGWDQFFHDWVGGEASAARAKDSPEAMRYNETAFAPIRAGLEERTGGGARDYLSHPYFQRPDPVSLVIDEVENVWAPIAQDDDWTLFDAKLRHIHELRDAGA